MKRFLVIGYCILFMAGTLSLSAQTFTPVYTTAIGSNITGYYEYLPQGYGLPQNAGKRYPVIFYFHGGTDLGNSNGNNNDLERLKKNGIPQVIAKGAMPAYFNNGTDTFQYIIICPQFKNDYPQSDAALVIDYILAQTSTYRIDAGKVYLTGFSLGGRATWQYLMSSLANSKKIAAALPISQYCFPAPAVSFTINPAQAGVALWAIHNSNDNTAPPSTCGTPYINAFNSFNPVIPAKISIACVPNAQLCGHIDTMPNQIYNPSLYTLPGTSQSVYQWLYQFRQLAAGYPPVARAGVDQAFSMPVTGAQLNGTASSDIDGTIISYAWRKLNGPVSGSIGNSGASVTALNNLVAGIYNFELRVTDNQGFTAKDTAAVTVTNPNPNLLPVANAGNDAEIFLPVNTFNLNGSGSYDSDGDIETYQWQKISGPASYSISNVNIVNPAVMNLVKGMYGFQLKVTDNQNGIKYDTVLVKVTSTLPNIPPVSNAGADQFIILPSNSVSLTGSGTDADGIIVSYGWNKISGPVNFSISTPSAASTTVTGLTEGVYSFELAVTDDSNAVRKDTMNVTVTASQRILIDAGAASLTPSPDASGKYWNNMTDARAGIRVQNAKTTANVTTTLNLEVVNRIDGTYNTGGNGMSTGNTTGAVVDYPATATTDYAFAYTGTSNGQWKFTGLDSLKQYSIKFWGAKSDVGPRIIEIKRSDSTTWKEYDAAFNTDYNRAAIFTFSGKTQLSFDIRAKASSQFGYINVVDITMVSLGSPVNVAPVARAGNDINISLPTNTASLNAAASADPDGSIVSYRWKKISGPSATITDTTAATTAVTNLSQGSYNFELTVTDNSGATGKDTMIINVAAAGNLAPVAKAGNDIVITHPLDSLTLDGTASTDPDGTIASYTWTKISGPAEFQIANASSAATILRDLKAGVYNFELKVTDNIGAVSKDTISIMVNAMPMPAPSNTDIASCNKPFKIVVLGSSTAFGTGAVPIDSSWVNKYTRYIKTKNAQSDIINLAVGGYTTYQVLNPNGYTAPSGRPAPDTAHNITKALSYLPDAILINLPTNDVASAFPDAEQKANYERTMALANAAGVPVWVTTTQPRNSLSNAQYDSLKEMRDWTLQRFGNKAVDFWSTVSTAAGTIANVYNYDDVHVNNYGHYIFFSRMVAGKILDSLCNRINNPPVAKAGNDTVITFPASTVILNGTASFDSDGSISNYLWTKISGPAAGNISNSSAAQTNVTALAKGIYLFELKVTDNKGAWSTDLMKVTVSGGLNIPPTANAGSDQFIILPSNSVSLTGNGTDADGIIVSYGWNKIAGPVNFSISSPSTASTTVTGLTEGVYSFELTVTDDSNAVRKDTMNVTVTASQRILIDAGSASLTPSPDASGKYWNNMTDARAGIRVQNAKTTANVTTTLNLEVVNRIDGTYNTGGNGMSTGNTTGAVVDYPATATTDYAFAYTGTSNGQWKFTGLDSLKQYSIKFWGAKSDVGPRIIEIKRSDETAWKEYDAAFNTDYNRAAVFTFSGKTQLSFDIRAKVSSQFGYINVIDISIASSGNQPPVANAGTDRTIVLPKDSVVLNGNGSYDPEGGTIKYKWTKISGPVSYQVNNDSIASPAITNLQQGIYQFELKVTDNGNLSAKDTVAVTVNAFVNNPPVARAGNDINITLPVNNVALNGSGSTDIDGMIVTYRWKKISGPSQGNITDTTAANTTATNLAQGNYQFELTVTDNIGATGKDTVAVSVRAVANIPPVARAGSDLIITLPVNSVNLDGTASSDADGSITFLWTKISGPAQYNISDATVAQPLISNLAQGIYGWELKVTDNVGAVSKDTVSVTVNAAQQSFTRQRVLIDVGPDNNNSGQQVASPDAMGKYWNYLTDGRPGIRVVNAVDSSNHATGLNVEVINRIDGTSPISPIGMNFINSAGIIGDYPAAATYDNAFAHSSATNGQWKITGLDPAKTYSIKFWGTRSTTGARIIQIKKNTDAVYTQEYDATGNTDYNRAAVISNISGVTEQIFDIRVKPGYDYGNISVMDIIITSPAGARMAGNANAQQDVFADEVTSKSTQQNINDRLFSIYPNPFKDELLLQYSGKEMGNGIVTIFNSNMNRIASIPVFKDAKTFQQHINLKNAGNGLYFIRLTIGSKTMIKRLIKTGDQ
ncbi:MAG: PKD domain-containing protein [Ferruginibacter sp.]